MNAPDSSLEAVSKLWGRKGEPKPNQAASLCSGDTVKNLQKPRRLEFAGQSTRGKTAASRGEYQNNVQRVLFKSLGKY